MTEPKAPSFNGVEIREGDTGTIRITFAGIYADGTLRVSANVLGKERFAAVEVESIATHTPAPRPLVPGPAVIDEAVKATVIAVDGSHAWVVSGPQHSIMSISRLRNTEGAAS